MSVTLKTEGHTVTCSLFGGDSKHSAWAVLGYVLAGILIAFLVLWALVVIALPAAIGVCVWVSAQWLWRRLRASVKWLTEYLKENDDGAG